MTLKNLAIMCVAVGTLGHAMAAGEGFTLKRVPKEGEVIKYRGVGKLELDSGAVDLTTVMAWTVLKVEADGTYTLQKQSTEAKVKVAGNELDVPRPITFSVYKPSGDLSELRGDTVTPQSYRMANITGFFAPEKTVNVGDTWIKEVKSDPNGSVPLKAEFKVVAEEKVGSFDCLKITGVLRETDGDAPSRVEATYWISKTDGSMAKYEGKWINVTVPGSSTPINGSMKFTRIE